MAYALHNYGDKGIPFHSVLNEGGFVVAYPQGGTFSEKGLGLICKPMQAYTAHFGGYEDEPVEGVKVYAYNLEAAQACIKDQYTGDYELYVKPDEVYLGEFTA